MRPGKLFSRFRDHGPHAEEFVCGSGEQLLGDLIAYRFQSREVVLPVAHEWIFLRCDDCGRRQPLQIRLNGSDV